MGRSKGIGMSRRRDNMEGEGEERGSCLKLESGLACVGVCFDFQFKSHGGIYLHWATINYLDNSFLHHSRNRRFLRNGPGYDQQLEKKSTNGVRKCILTYR